MKKVWTYIIGFLCIVGGVFLVVSPGQSISMLIYYVGLVLLATGILKVLSSIISKKYFVPDSSFLSGVWNVIFGLILMFNQGLTMSVIPTFIGLWLIITSLSSLIVMFNFRKTYLDTRRLFTCIFKLIVGIVVLTTPILLAVLSGVLIGIVLILIGVWTIVSNLKKDKVYKVRVK